MAVVLQSVARDIAADIVYVACEKCTGVRIETRIDSLRKVDDAHLVLPVKHVIGREVGMDVVVSQPEFDVAHQAIKDGVYLVPGEFDALEGWRCPLKVTEELHQDSAAAPGKRFGNVRACFFIERVQGGEFVVDPHAELGFTPETRFVLHDAAHMPVEDETPLLVNCIVLEAAIVARAIDLCRKQFYTGRGMRLTASRSQPFSS